MRGLAQIEPMISLSTRPLQYWQVRMLGLSLQITLTPPGPAAKLEVPPVFGFLSQHLDR